jgi:hypothetical protein
MAIPDATRWGGVCVRLGDVPIWAAKPCHYRLEDEMAHDVGGSAKTSNITAIQSNRSTTDQ